MSTIVSTQFQLPQSVISNGFITGNPWTNPKNALLVDGDFAESNPNNAASDFILGNYLANLPQNAVITGIQMQLIAKAGAPTSPPITLTPQFVDDSSGQNVYYPYQTPFAGLTQDLDSYILGSPTYLFATSFTPDQINNMKFALVANGDIYVDSFLVQVFYYVPDTVTPPATNGNMCLDCNSVLQTPQFSLALPFLIGDTTFRLQSFNYADGTPILYEDLGSCGGYIDFIFDEGQVQTQGSNFMENVQVASWTTLADGTVEFNIVSVNNRGLQFHTPYEHDDALMSDHDANSPVIISNNGPYEGQRLHKCQVGTVFSAPINVAQNNTDVVNPATKFNFLGNGVVVQPNISNPLEADITIPGAAGTAPPVIVSVISATSGSVQVGSISATLDVSGLNRGAVVQVLTQYLGGSNVATVTVGGVACVQKVTSQDSGHDLDSEIWVCTAPPLGPQPVVVTLTAPAYVTIGAECISGMDSATPVGTTQNASGNNNSPTLALVTTYDNSTVIDSLGTAMTPILYTPGPGQGLNWSLTANTDTRQGGSSVESAGLQPDTITMDYSITQSTPWVYCAVEIKGITATEPVVSGVLVQNVSGSTSVSDVVKIVVPNGTITAPGGGEVDLETTMSRVTNADTTPNFLQAKLIAGSGMTITKQNSGANENLLFTATGAGGGGSLGVTLYNALVSGTNGDGVIDSKYDPVNSVYYVLVLNFSTGSNTLTVSKISQDMTSGVWYISAQQVAITSSGNINDACLALDTTNVYVMCNHAVSQNNQLAKTALGLGSSFAVSTIAVGGGYILSRGVLFSDNTSLWLFASNGSTEQLKQFNIAGSSLIASFTIAGFGAATVQNLFVDITNSLAYGVLSTAQVTFATFSVTGGSITQTATYTLNFRPGINSGNSIGSFFTIYGTASTTLSVLLSYAQGYVYTVSGSPTSDTLYLGTLLTFDKA